MKRLLQKFFSSTGPLADLSSSYTPRSEQVRLAQAVADTLPGGVLLADAPTGTGKSMGYLAPLALSGRPAVISTASIALQHQLIEHDLPLAKAAASALTSRERNPTFALLKGRTNFLCHARLENAVSGSLGLGLEKVLEPLGDWVGTTKTGDREELSFRVPGWAEIASEPDDCVPHRCPHRPHCFYLSQREKAQEAQILVVNHALLLANAASFNAVFDARGRVLIVDEAHRLEEFASQIYGAHVTARRFRYAVRSIEKRARNAGRHTEPVQNAADRFFDEISRSRPALGDPERTPTSYHPLLRALRSLEEFVDREPDEEVKKLANLVGKLRRDLQSFFEPARDTHAYAVVAPHRKDDPSELKSWLVETGEVLREDLFARERDAATILTSATLATGSSFRYARSRLGLADDPGDVPEDAGEHPPIRELRAQEAFDYENRCLLYLESEIEEPNHGSERFALALTAEKRVRRVEELLGLSRGRALVLCSTARAVEGMRRSLRTAYPVRFQGDASPSRLVAWMKATPGACIVGTKTFFEGVDLPGPSLSMVILDRCPYPPPDDPVIEAMCEKAGKDWFRSVSMPKAVISLRQGAGRLMRSSTDRGVIAMLDPRIKTKPWGRAILRSLPPAPATSSLHDVAAFFAREEAQHTQPSPPKT